MNAKNKRTSKLIIPNTFRVLLVFLLLCGFAHAQNTQQEGIVLKYSSGDDEIDQIRRDIKVVPTDESNWESRGYMLKLWELALQQQGVILAGRYQSVYIDRSNIESITNLEERKNAIARVAKQI